jgi:hypothetical protein
VDSPLLHRHSEKFDRNVALKAIGSAVAPAASYQGMPSGVPPPRLSVPSATPGSGPRIIDENFGKPLLEGKGRAWSRRPLRTTAPPTFRSIMIRLIPGVSRRRSIP